MIRCENENAIDPLTRLTNRNNREPIQRLCSENFCGNRFRLILQNENDQNYCGFKVKVENYENRSVLIATPEENQSVQKFSSFISLKSAETKLTSSYLRLTDYTNDLGALFLPLTLKNFDSKSVPDYPENENLRQRAKNKINFSLYRRHADYLTGITSILDNCLTD